MGSSKKVSSFIVVLVVVILLGQFAWFLTGPGVRLGRIEEEEKDKGIRPLAIVAVAPRNASKNSKLHIVVYDELLNPVSDAEILVDGELVGKTDRRGVLIHTINNREPSKVVARKLIKGVPAQGTILLPQPVNSKEKKEVEIFVYTDRGIYRPGETVHIRILGWRIGRRIETLSGEKIKILLKKENGEELWGQIVHTDDYGVAFCDLPLIKNMPEGYYMLYVEHKGHTAFAPIKVKLFRTPVIQIDADMPEWITPSDKVFEMKLLAGYYSCMPLEGATYIVEILDKSGVRYKKIGSLEDGKPFRLRISGRELKKLLRGLKPDSDKLTVRITVVDRFGRKDTIERVIEYTTCPYIVGVKTPARSLKIGEEFDLRIVVRDKLNRPAAFKMVIVRTDKKEYPGVTDKNGVAIVRLKQVKKIQKMSVFVEGVKHSSASVTTYASEGKETYILAEVSRIKDEASAFVTITISAKFIPLEKVVHVDIVSPEGGLEKSFEVPLEAMGQGWQSGFRVAPEFWGRGTLIAWCMAKRRDKATPGILVAGEFLDVDRRGNLTVLLSNIPSVVRPGSELGVTVEVKDDGGEPVSAALGVCVADEAALSLLDPLRVKPEETLYAAAESIREGVWPIMVHNFLPFWHLNLARPPFGWYPAMVKDPDKYTTAPNIKTRKSVVVFTPRPRPRNNGFNYIIDEFGYVDVYGIGGAASGNSNRPIIILDQEAIIPRGISFDHLSNKNLSSSYNGYGVGGSSISPPKVRIRIRTNFAETAFWEPNLKSEDGRFDIRFCLPDSVTVNRLTVLATDKKGGVRTVTMRIRTNLDFFVRSDMPTVLVLGDEVEFGVVVANRTDKDLCARVDVMGDGLTILGERSRGVLVPAGGMAAVRFKVRADRIGTCRYTIRAVTQEHADGISKTVEVVPPYQPIVKLIRDIVKGGHLVISFKLPRDDIKRVCLVSLTYPGLQTMLQSVEDMASYPHG